MRLFSFASANHINIGAELNGRLVDLNTAHAARLAKTGAMIAPTMHEFIQLSEGALAKAHLALAFVAAEPNRARGCFHELGDVKLLAPIPRPGKIFCSGLNYRSHVEENPAATFLADPRFFVKVSSAVIGPGEPIRWPGEKFQVDYEVELAVIIGRPARRLTQKNALHHVFGYTIFHDVSARWVQFKDKNEDMGKNFDTFAPMGPCICHRRRDSRSVETPALAQAERPTDAGPHQ